MLKKDDSNADWMMQTSTSKTMTTRAADTSMTATTDGRIVNNSTRGVDVLAV